jgi:uncharacterized protein YyaL (SSP411 family)
MPNRLIRETSPYLLQHAHNPVDWYPWGPEALEKARREDKPIFLSIGYSSCHWCHVMEHESFEDIETAALLNQRFVPIKVDREERPDLDSIYMSAVVAMTGQGGWPMSMFLTPDGAPFYGGTYFPNVRRHGLLAFQEVLRAIAEAWQNRRAEILSNGSQVVAALNQSDLPGVRPTDEPLENGTLDEALEKIRRAFDWTNGGWGGAPKFPQPMTIEFLIRRYVATRDELILRMITETLNRMARGGIYDQLGGGFHRYATDAIWLVPHFEKMLYDNAQLARVYLHAWQITHNEFYRRIAEETLDYVAHEMTDPGGGFYSSQDADSEGVEGKFFVWTPEEIRAALGEEAQLFIDAYGVTERGNFEGKNILYVARDADVLAAMHTLSMQDVETRLVAARQKLFEVREGRVKPARDEKVLTGWNGLMLAAFAEAARVLKREDYRTIAERNADFLLRELRDRGGRLHRSWKAGNVRHMGYLEDYANLIEGLLALYETTFDAQWFVAARELADTMLEHFADPAGGFFDTSDDAEALVTRPKDLQDNAVPSGNAMAAIVLLKLGAFTGEGRYTDAAERALRMVQPALGSAPTGFAQWLSALDFALGEPREIAIVGDGGADKLLDVVWSEYRPNQVVACARGAEDASVPLLERRTPLNGKATAYVCRNFVCELPVTEPEALAAQLQR